MSDRLSSVEIEDVLSSIRRLVSDDLRPKVVDDIVPQAEKLLLTPALRVVSNVPEAPFADLSDDAGGIEDAVALIGAGVPLDGYEPETGDAVMSVPEWPESTWDAPDMIDAVEAAQVVEIVPVDVAPAAAEAMQDEALQSWADEAEAEVVASLQADEAVFPQGATFDEAVLRDLVRDLIREELQGALGERITRNVRKLVRSELNRVLAVTDFE